jgi:uncharacterized membrane protein
MGGFFNDLYGFRFTCDIFAFSSLIFGFIYLFVNVIPFMEMRRKKEENAVAKVDIKQ